MVPFRPLRSGENQPPTQRYQGEAALEAAFPLLLVDLFYDRPLARLNHIGSVVALDVAIVTQASGIPDRPSRGRNRSPPTPARAPRPVLLPVVRCSVREERACLRMISRSLSESYRRVELVFAGSSDPSIGGNEKERQGLRQRAEFARRNS
jgi:hypothetical protein